MKDGYLVLFLVVLSFFIGWAAFSWVPSDAITGHVVAESSKLCEDNGGSCVIGKCTGYSIQDSYDCNLNNNSKLNEGMYMDGSCCIE